jgi:triacylglycerol esterase/lipase EstA (alpha/beta hydrolase family)
MDGKVVTGRGMRTFLLGAIAAAIAVFCASASAAPPYPVSYSFQNALTAQGQAPDSPPPGANDFTCKPSAEHPEPVVLVHGLLSNQTVNFQTISPLLANDGYCVFSLTFGTRPEANPPFYQPGGLTKMESSAQQLSDFVDRVLTTTGAAKIDIVGHSEGSLMPEYYVKFGGGAAKVDKYVGLTTIWNGTDVLGLATLARLGTPLGLTPALVGGVNQFCESCDEFLTGSEFMNKLRSGGLAVPGVTYTNIVTQYDELVVPYTSGIMDPGPNVTNHVVQEQCPTDFAEHMTVVFDPVAETLIQNALAPDHPRPVPCTVVLPMVGAPLWPAPAPLDSNGDGTPDYADVTHG